MMYQERARAWGPAAQSAPDCLPAGDKMGKIVGFAKPGIKRLSRAKTLLTGA